MLCLLGVIALRPLIVTRTVRAQSSSSTNQIPFAFLQVPSTSDLNGTTSQVPINAIGKTVYGMVFFDQDTGNVWGYPMYTSTTSVTLSGVKAVQQPSFGPPTLYGTFNGPGQPMSPPQ